MIVYPRFTRSSADQIEKSYDKESKPKDLEENFQELKSFLTRKAVEDHWNFTTIDNEGNESTRNLTELDFDKIRYSKVLKAYSQISAEKIRMSFFIF